MKSLRVTMPDGNKYDVPVDLIALHRAEYYAKRDTGKSSGPEFDKVLKQEFDCAMKDADDIVDWAANNMNWSDVSEHAKKVDRILSPEDFQEGWVNGDKEII